MGSTVIFPYMYTLIVSTHPSTQDAPPSFYPAPFSVPQSPSHFLSPLFLLFPISGDLYLILLLCKVDLLIYRHK